MSKHPFGKGTYMKTNDLKKGTRILLANDWEADLWDNQRGNTRIANVFGIETEAGSVYSHDIVAYKLKGDTEWRRDIEYTPAQEKLRKATRWLGL
jgi:hypothetical protein